MRRAVLATQQLETSVGGANKAMLAGAVASSALTGALIIGTQQAIRFQTAIAEIKTLFDDFDTPSNIQESVINLSNAFGTDKITTAKAYYQTVSAGFTNAAQSAQVMDAANKLAIGGVTDIFTAVDGLTSVLNAYSNEGLTATEATDALFQAVRSGKTTVDELSRSIGLVAPLAAQMGVTFQELTSSIASLTQKGIRTRIAITGLRQVLSSYSRPIDSAAKASDDLNIAFDASTIRTEGLVGAFEELINKTGGSVEILAQLFGGVESLNPVLALLSDNLLSLNDILALTEGQSGQTEAAFRILKNTFQYQFNVLRQQINSELVSIAGDLSTKMIPVLQDLNENFDKISDSIVVAGRTLADLARVLKIAVPITVVVAAFAKLIAVLAATKFATLSLTGAISGLWVAISAHPLGALIGVLAAATVGIAIWKAKTIDGVTEVEKAQTRALEKAREFYNTELLQIKALDSTKDLEQSSYKAGAEQINQFIAGRQRAINASEGVIAEQEARLARIREERGTDFLAGLRYDIEAIIEAEEERIDTNKFLIGGLREEFSLYSDLYQIQKELTDAEELRKKNEEEMRNILVKQIADKQALQAYNESLLFTERLRLRLMQEGGDRLQILQQQIVILSNEWDRLVSESSGLITDEMIQAVEELKTELESIGKVKIAISDLEFKFTNVETLAPSGEKIEEFGNLKQQAVDLLEQIRELDGDYKGLEETILKFLQRVDEAVEKNRLPAFMEDLVGELGREQTSLEIALRFGDITPDQYVAELERNLTTQIELLNDVLANDWLLTLDPKLKAESIEKIKEEILSLQDEFQLKQAIDIKFADLRQANINQFIEDGDYEDFRKRLDQIDQDVNEWIAGILDKIENPEIRAELQKLFRIKDPVDDWREAERIMKNIGGAVLDVADAFGVLDDASRRVLDGMLTIAASLPGIFAKGGADLSSVLSAIGGAASILSAVFGRDDSENQKIIRDNTQALRELKLGLRSLDFVGDIQGRLVPQFEEFVNDFTQQMKRLSGTGINGVIKALNNFDKTLNKYGLTHEDVERLASEMGLEFSHTTQFLNEFNDALQNLTISDAFTSVEGAMEKLRAEIELFDIGPLGELDKLRDQFLGFVNLPAELEKEIASLDLNNAIDRDAFLDIIKQLYKDIDNITFGELDQLTPDQFLQWLVELKNATDAAEEFANGVGNITDSLTNVPQIFKTAFRRFSAAELIEPAIDRANLEITDVNLGSIEQPLPVEIENTEVLLNVDELKSYLEELTVTFDTTQIEEISNLEIPLAIENFNIEELTIPVTLDVIGINFGEFGLEELLNSRDSEVNVNSDEAQQQNLIRFEEGAIQVTSTSANPEDVAREVLQQFQLRAMREYGDSSKWSDIV